MSQVEAEVTPLEARLTRALRARIEERVDQMGRASAAERISSTPAGVDALLWRSDWSPARALHLAALLDVLTESDIEAIERGSAA
jgi:hypothetical protein